MDTSLNIDSTVSYPKSSPFHPDQIYPELQLFGFSETDTENTLYKNVRSLFEDLKLDTDKIGTPEWNPFSDFIKPGDCILIKPNLVLHHNKRGKDINAVVVHASVLRPLVDYSLLALKGKGQIIIGDAPHGDADFEAIVKLNGLKELVTWYKDFKGIIIELRDFRKFVYPNGFDVSVSQAVNNDPDGYAVVDLGSHSSLINLPNISRLYGSDYNRKFIVQQHLDRSHKYLISGTVLNADVVISVPKLKTHKKTGITINLKNLVGINGDKNYLAHYRVGTPSQGGDEYPDTRNIILKIMRAYNEFSRDILLAPNKLTLRYVNRFIRIPFLLLSFIINRFSSIQNIDGGNWYGNDTCWRMCLDLNYILRFANKKGVLQDTPQRRYFCLVDGIIAGEGNGPLEPDPKNCGILAAGHDPYKTDYVCTYIMGLDPVKIKLISHSISDPRVGYSPNDLKVVSRKNGLLTPYKELNFYFKPNKAWRGKIERNG